MAERSLKGRALRALAAREHSRAELERKLAAHEQEPGELARVLDELQAHGFINAARVADSVLHRRAAQRGTARIVGELQAKGLPEDVVADAARQLRATEVERAREAWRKKFGCAAKTPDERARQMRFLAGRGFSSEAIRTVLKEAAQLGADAAGA